MRWTTIASKIGKWGDKFESSEDLGAPGFAFSIANLSDLKGEETRRVVVLYELHILRDVEGCGEVEIPF